MYYRICHTKKNWQFKKEMHIIRLYEESANQFLCNTSWQYKQVTISIAQYYVNKDAIEMLRWLLAWSRNQTILHNPKSEFNHHPFNKNTAYVAQGIKIHLWIKNTNPLYSINPSSSCPSVTYLHLYHSYQYEMHK